MAELNAAKQRLEALEAQGSALDKFNAAVSRVEGGYQKLLYCSRSNIVGAVTGIINGGSRFRKPGENYVNPEHREAADFGE